MSAKWWLEVSDAALFARNHLGFEPDEKQRVVLSTKVHRGILNCSRQWGKSTVAAAKAVHLAATTPGSLTVVLSPTGRQSGEFLRKAEGFVRRLDLRAKGDGHNEHSLLLPNGARIIGLPGVEGTVRGYSAVSLVLIDEASRVPDDLYKAVRPMLAVGGGDLWLMSTPAGQRGFFYDEWANGGSHWTRVAVTGAECSRIAPEFLEEERVAQGDRWFRQEYCCEFTDADDCVFDMDKVRAVITDEVPPLPMRRAG